MRFEMCAIALDASLTTIAPWRDAEFLESFKGRTDLLNYAAKHNIPVDATPKVRDITTITTTVGSIHSCHHHNHTFHAGTV